MARARGFVLRAFLARSAQVARWVTGSETATRPDNIPGGVERHSLVRSHGSAPPRNLAGNPDSPQAVVFLTSLIDITVGG